MHRRLEQAVAALAVALGDVHRGVGVADQLVGVGGARRRRPSRCRCSRATTSSLCSSASGSGERLEDALGGVGRLLRGLDVLEQHGELVAAEARGGVARRGCSSPRRLPTSSSTWSPAAWPRLSLIVLKSSRSMKMTARPMSSRRARATAWRTRSANSARLARPVTGSWKAWCGELLLEGLALGDVAAVEDDAADVLVVEQVRVLDLEVQRRAVAVAQRALEDCGAGRAGAGGGVVEQVQQAALLARRQQLGRSACRRRRRACSRARARWTGSGRRSARRSRAP